MLLPPRILETPQPIEKILGSFLSVWNFVALHNRSHGSFGFVRHECFCDAPDLVMAALANCSFTQTMYGWRGDKAQS